MSQDGIHATDIREAQADENTEGTSTVPRSFPYSRGDYLEAPTGHVYRIQNVYGSSEGIVMTMRRVEGVAFDLLYGMKVRDVAEWTEVNAP